MAEKCKTEVRSEFDQNDYYTVREGMYVCGADYEKIGEVHDLYRDTYNAPGYVVVEKRKRLPNDLYIPVSAIAKMDRDNVFLECGADECTKKGWDKKPPLGAREPGLRLRNRRRTPR